MKRHLVPGLLAFALVVAGCSSSTNSDGAAPTTTAATGDAATTAITVPHGYTPLVMTPMSNGTFPFQGSDGRYHVVYDLQITNASDLPATLDKVEVVAGDDPTRVVASFGSEQLVNEGDPATSVLRSVAIAPAESTTIGAEESRALYMQFDARSASELPDVVVHHLYMSAKTSPGATEVGPMDYLATPFNIADGTPRVISPPVKGANWIALNGCCDAGFPHRSSLAPFDGKLGNSQRFAIDWKRANDQGEFVTGDKSLNESYVDYGADVYAVAGGTVVEVLDDMEANTPGILPAQDPEMAKTLTVDNVDGNHVVLDLGGGVYAMYAHFMKGSITVKVGDKVQRGDKIAQLGNTGNSNASHLHFQLMNGPALSAADGVPYVFDSFVYRGQMDQQAFDETDNFLSGSFFPPDLSAGDPRTDQLPLQLAIVDFPD